MVPGSYLAITHATSDFKPDRAADAVSLYRGNTPLVPRTRSQVDALFSGLDYVEPGLVRVTQWRPDHTPTAADNRIGIYGAVGRKN
jgi:hypothetical protein